MSDPLKLQRAMRFYPHDDNQGGFFVAVFEKFAEVKSSKDDPFAGDHFSLGKRKNIMDEMEDFAKWYEAEQKREWDRNNVPESEREDLGLMD